jgi:hypothetical protein
MKCGIVILIKRAATRTKTGERCNGIALLYIINLLYISSVDMGMETNIRTINQGGGRGGGGSGSPPLIQLNIDTSNPSFSCQIHGQVHDPPGQSKCADGANIEAV